MTYYCHQAYVLYIYFFLLNKNTLTTRSLVQDFSIRSYLHFVQIKLNFTILFYISFYVLWILSQCLADLFGDVKLVAILIKLVTFGDDVVNRQKDAVYVSHNGGSSLLIKQLCVRCLWPILSRYYMVYIYKFIDIIKDTGGIN